MCLKCVLSKKQNKRQRNSQKYIFLLLPTHQMTIPCDLFVILISKCQLNELSFVSTSTYGAKGDTHYSGCRYCWGPVRNAENFKQEKKNFHLKLCLMGAETHRRTHDSPSAWHERKNGKADGKSVERERWKMCGE